jgi:penicillin-binding protein 2
MRIKSLKKIIFAFFVLLTLGLAYNQLVKGDHFLQLSQNNRIKLVRLSAPRGLVYDRNNRVLAGTRLMFNVAILAQEVKDVQQILKKISPILNISRKELLRRFRNNFFAPFIPVVVAWDIPKEAAIALESQESDFPGLIIQTEALRSYQFGKALGHILGYVGSISEEELKRFKEYGLRHQDLLGRSGVEKQFDYYLRGHSGGMQVEVNSQGHKMRVLSLKQAQKGETLYLTIDAQLQKFIADLLEEKKGVCIVMNVHNGEILAMVSSPSFDSNLFIAGLNKKSKATRRIREMLNNSEDAVLVNRAISGTYPPGSIFKIIVAAAGLETNKINPKSKMHCSGSFKVGNRDFFCWNLEGHGMLNLTQAIAHSCNVFFYRLGLALGVEKLTSFAYKFGLGSATGIDLPYEAKGLVPSKIWKLKTVQERWYDGETANFAIGQGYLLTTPLQIARMISAVANGGYLVQPHIKMRLGGEKAEVLRKNIGLQKRTLEVIKNGMLQVICNDKGTGHRAYIPGIQWAAKTGTAQTTQGVSHAWFGGFFPFEQPQILVLVFLEHGGSGGETPAIIAKEIVKYIMENNAVAKHSQYINH